MKISFWQILIVIGLLALLPILLHSNRVNDNLQLDAEMKRLNISDAKFAQLYERVRLSVETELRYQSLDGTSLIM
jgi:hypothetical protein